MMFRTVSVDNTVMRMGLMQRLFSAYDLVTSINRSINEVMKCEINKMWNRNDSFNNYHQDLSPQDGILQPQLDYRITKQPCWHFAISQAGV